MSGTEQESAEDEYWMKRALRMARFAEAMDEVPVGAVLTLKGRLLAVGCNRMVGSRDPSAHAEIVALRRAARRLDNYRLTGATLYVTLEPCAMCAGALIQARIERLVFATHDPRAGACGSQIDLSACTWSNHHFVVHSGVEAVNSAQLLRAFFKRRRRQSTGSPKE